MSLKIGLLFLLLAIWATQGTLAVEVQSSLNEPETRVVGGQNVPDGAVKYLVSLRNYWTNEAFCGGSIIDHRWILTAAHCVSGVPPANIIAVAGTVSRTKGCVFYKFDKIINHEKYSRKPLVNDIALLRTTTEIKYNSKIDPIGIPVRNAMVGEKALLSGWGYVDGRGQQLDDTMQWLNVTVDNLSHCKEVLKRTSGEYPVTENTICTYENYKGTCQGDSGGGLVQNYAVIGIVSWNIPCARGYPDVYTNVFAYRKWIKDNMKKNKP